MILVVGARGAMGRRYGTILRWLHEQGVPGCDARGVDIETTPADIRKKALGCSGVIIATPTDTHGSILRHLVGIQAPVLCEKPIVKDIPELKEILAQYKDSGTPFRMVNQYRVMASANRIGHSFYNYFRHGNDGIYWDCMQIIGLARGDLYLSESSPVWQCKINGQALRIEAMDAAYIAYVQEWFRKPNQDPGEILSAHEKTAALERVHAYG